MKTAYKNFSQQTWDRIKHTLDLFRKNESGHLYAAFDADGTLWDTDVGEMFFDYQIHHCGLPDLPPDPWAHYHQMKEQNTRAAYLWLAQINAGQKIEQVRSWAKQAVKQAEISVFDEQARLIELLKTYNIKCFVVTASIKWAVEPAAELVGLSPADVLGVQSKVTDRVVGLEQEGLITWREGKPESLLLHTGGERPVFCSGNTMGDFALLNSSRGLSMAVSATGPEHENHQTEMELQAHAEAKGWLVHRF